MPLQPIETRRLYRHIADQVAGLIARGEFPPGSRLPTERELALLLGVSGPSVREGLIALEVEGLVDVRVGSGIYVRRARAGIANPDILGDSPGPFELLRARRAIEGEVSSASVCEAAGVAATRHRSPVNRQKRFTRRICAKEATRVRVRAGCATTNAKDCAREMATFRR